jgi:hypothetical protein
MLQNYVRQLLVFAFILVSFKALGQSFGTSASARYGDGCRLDFYNVSNVKIFSLRGSELRYWYNPSNQIIVRDENTQVTDLYGITGLAALIDSVQSICLAGLCSTTPPDTNTYSFCGSPLFDYFNNNQGFGDNDTITGTSSANIISLDDSIYLHLFNTGISYEDYNYGTCLGGIGCDTEIDSCATNNDLECSKVENLSITVGGQSETYIDYFQCSEVATVNPQGWLYTFEGTQFDTLELNTFAITASSDTVIKNDIIIPIEGDFSTLRILGTNFSNITKTDDAISITAKPVKTSGQTYATNSFKIQKLAYADIDAPVISEQVYNPNSGEQTKSLAITTGKNTYCIQVADTNGNIAYTIFQLTKTVL